MARGDMTVDTLSVGTDVEILNRKENEAVAMTVDFASVTETADNGKKIVKAGTPVDKDGVPIAATPWTGAVGIIKYDVYENHPQVAMLKKAYIHTTRAQSHNGLTYDGALISALNLAGCRIAFEEPVIVGA